MLKKLMMVAVGLAMMSTVALADRQLLEVGAEAPDFFLFGVDYKYHELSEYLASEDTKAVVVIMMCNHCPVVVRYQDKMIELANEYQPKGIPFIGINVNPADMVAADSFPNMVKRAEEKKYPFPYVYDETQRVANAYGPSRTPEIFVVSKEGKLVYTGAIDEKGNDPQHLANALDDILAGREVQMPKTQPTGCTVKYRPEPKEE